MRLQSLLARPEYLFVKKFPLHSAKGKEPGIDKPQGFDIALEFAKTYSSQDSKCRDAWKKAILARKWYPF